MIIHTMIMTTGHGENLVLMKVDGGMDHQIPTTLTMVGCMYMRIMPGICSMNMDIG